MSPVGFLGLGIMGNAMVKKLVTSGSRVVLWNRSLDKAHDLCTNLDSDLISVASSPAEVAKTCNVTYAMLSDPKASIEVAMGMDASVVAGLRERGNNSRAATYVDCSTIDEHTGEKIAKEIHSTTNASYLAAPVSGGWRDAAKGELLFICGGSKDAYDAPWHLEGRRWLVGESPQSAARTKLMLQTMMGNIVGALGEMVSLSDRAGLDTNMVLDILNAGAMGNSLAAAKGKLMRDGDYSPNFQVYLQQKDLKLALALADELSMPAPITAASNAQYIRAKQLGFAEADFAAVRAAYTAARPYTPGGEATSRPPGSE
jgi:glyoxylate/succinic semialdehyde reductase